MYEVRFVNFGYSKHFDNCQEAIHHMKKAGFESVLLKNDGHQIGYNSPISGFRYFGE